MTDINIRLYPPRIRLRHQNHPYPRRLPRQIDAQLYAKYGLAKSEQKFIESMINPMEPSGTFRGSLNF